MIALSTSSTITISVIGFFAFIAIVSLTRALLVRKPPSWKRYRVGLFVERDPSADEAPLPRDNAERRSVAADK